MLYHDTMCRSLTRAWEIGCVKPPDARGNFTQPIFRGLLRLCTWRCCRACTAQCAHSAEGPFLLSFWSSDLCTSFGKLRLHSATCNNYLALESAPLALRMDARMGGQGKEGEGRQGHNKTQPILRNESGAGWPKRTNTFIRIPPKDPK